MNKPLMLTIIGAVSLVWGIHDLRKKDGMKTGYARAQTWGQIVAGLIALGFALLHWNY